MMAMESQDLSAIMGAIADTVDACVDDNININDLTMFDMEYMFVQLRGKSVGETTTINAPCNACKKGTEVSINLSDIEVNIPEVDNMIELTKDITVEMAWPSYISMTEMQIKTAEDLTTNAFNMIAKCIVAIHTEDERIMAKDTPLDEIEEFIESMTNDQFKKISNYIEMMPKVEKDIDWECEHCGEKGHHKLEGMMDFFT